MKLSLIINCDTRPQNNHAEKMFSGCVNFDFMTEGLKNKISFLRGFDLEVIVYVDKHEEIPKEILETLYWQSDVLIIRNHTNEQSFNDYNYIRALQMASGDIIVHFDQDVAAFTNSPEPINDMIKLLEVYDYISYPSWLSPNPVVDNNYDYFWCSTRFFMCKRETLDFAEIIKCLKDYDYLYQTYPASIRNHWTEHILALISKYKGKGVFYPAMNLDTHAIFSWDRYIEGVLKAMNNWSYEQVKGYIVNTCGGVHYPCDVTATTGSIVKFEDL